ncbi:hypothetical protein VUJ46_20060 [Chryseobacterium sp. MYb264]|uniref:hypothetical protein n=1 Tax=Chryseobacterium sp. MYb264 TaxID=2745153 RepID=UPI002E13C21D|nr:hypothetical protein VUJ46_20060 [Chryseobacterium sp. MYb264]
MIFVSFTLISCSKSYSKRDNKLQEQSDLKSFLKRHQGSPIDSFRFNITKDNIPDYLLFDESDYNSPIFFFDGKTEKSIANEKEITTRFFDFDTIYVDDKKKQNALLVGDGSGGNGGEYRYSQILKFDSATNSMKVIFEYPRFIRNNNKIEEVNYIKISKSRENYVDTISIFKGDLLQNEGDENLNIRPLSKHPLKVFIYNPYQGNFKQIK